MRRYVGVCCRSLVRFRSMDKLFVLLVGRVLVRGCGRLSIGLCRCVMLPSVHRLVGLSYALCCPIVCVTWRAPLFVPCVLPLPVWAGCRGWGARGGGGVGSGGACVPGGGANGGGSTRGHLVGGVCWGWVVILGRQAIRVGFCRPVLV